MNLKVGDSFKTADFCQSLLEDGISWDNSQHYLKEFAKLGYLVRLKIGTYAVAVPFWDETGIRTDIISKVETHYKATKKPYVEKISDETDVINVTEPTVSANISDMEKKYAALKDMGIDPETLPKVTDDSSLSFKFIKKAASSADVFIKKATSSTDVTDKVDTADIAETTESTELAESTETAETAETAVKVTEPYENSMLKLDGFVSDPYDFSKLSSNVLLADFEALKYLTNHYRSIHDRYVPTYAPMCDKIGSLAFRLPLIHMMFKILTELKNRYYEIYVDCGMDKSYKLISEELQSYGFVD